MEIELKFAERVKELRIKQRMSQKELGDILGLTAK